MSRVYGGLDPSASPNKPSGVAVIDHNGCLITMAHANTDHEIIDFFSKYKLKSLAIDAPKGLPHGMGLCCLEEKPSCDCELTKPRNCERELQRRGISVYPVTKNAFAKGWIRRGLLLYLRFQSLGFACEEVYPSGSKQRLFSDVVWLKPKSKLSARAQLVEQLNTLKLHIPVEQKPPSDHQLDAVLGAYSVYLFNKKHQGERLGDPAEGQILLP